MGFFSGRSEVVDTRQYLPTFFRLCDELLDEKAQIPQTIHQNTSASLNPSFLEPFREKLLELKTEVEERLVHSSNIQQEKAREKAKICEKTKLSILELEGFIALTLVAYHRQETTSKEIIFKKQKSFKEMFRELQGFLRELKSFEEIGTAPGEEITLVPKEKELQNLGRPQESKRELPKTNLALVPKEQNPTSEDLGIKTQWPEVEIAEEEKARVKAMLDKAPESIVPERIAKMEKPEKKGFFKFLRKKK
ncbi:MAG: hypothetical protein H6500_00995 [Candidatus Woesearchaeota archaeon]|nr:MAG: hypothetical protein H6500_00995 [Candidatus Woesearchaeota archaeon]